MDRYWHVGKINLCLIGKPTRRHQTPDTPDTRPSIIFLALNDCNHGYSEADGTELIFESSTLYFQMYNSRITTICTLKCTNTFIFLISTIFQFYFLFKDKTVRCDIYYFFNCITKPSLFVFQII